ncbi:MAG: response regulator [Vicinamibacterales bacterium]
MSPSPALVVEPVFSDVLLLVPILSALGFEITATEDFEEARQSLRNPPRLLVTEIRLGEFNGLHLVLRGRSARPDMAAIVTSTVDDPVLRHEAEMMGATFVLKPATADELQAAILRTVLRREPTPIRGPFERRRADRRVIPPAGLLPERRQSDRRADPRLRLAELTLN